MRAPTARFLLLACLLAVTACDSTTVGGEEEEPPEEDLGPITLEYYVNAPDDASDFAIFYTGADGEQVQVPTADPFAFPYVERLDAAFPSDAEGTFRLRFSGFVPAGAILVRIRAEQDGLQIEEALATAQGAGTGTGVTVETELVLGDG